MACVMPSLWLHLWLQGKPSASQKDVEGIDLPHLSEALETPAINGLGCVYVVQFCNGRIKVGSSQQVRTRLRSLTSGRLAESPRLLDGWHSDEHLRWRLNELRLLVFCHERFGDPVSGRETFAGDYASVLAHAQSLPLTEPEGASA
jgi:hypothetical protein